MTQRAPAPRAALLGACLFAGLAWAAGWNKPYGTDEVWFLLAGREAWKTGVPVYRAWGDQFFHPPLYAGLVGASLAAFGTWKAARLPGLLSAWGLLALTARAGADLGLAPWGLALLAVNPAFLQSSRLLEIDTSVLSLGLMATFVFAGEAERSGASAPLAAFGLAWAGSLWSKLTTPLLAGGVLVLRWSRALRASRAPAAALAASTAAALLLLWAWCLHRGLPFGEMTDYILGALKTRRPPEGGQFAALAPQAVQELLWFSPGALALFAWGLAARARRWLRASGDALESFGLYAVLGFIGYTYVGGTPFGFPKYEAAMLPAACLVAATTWPRVEVRRLLAAVLLAAAALAWAGDPILSFRWDLRMALAEGRGRQAALAFAGLCAFWNLAPLAAAAAVFRRKTTLAASLWVLALSQSLALDARQACAPYDTLNNYGERGAAEAAAALKAAWKPGDGIVASYHLLGMLGWEGIELPLVPKEAWSDRRLLEPLVADPRTRLFAFGPAGHTIDQLRLLRSEGWREFLAARGFERAAFGDHEVWTRLEPGGRG